MKRTKILIVEDDKNTLNGLVEILGQEGYDVTGAESAAAALQILHAHRFEIMLTDLRLPDMNGMELYHKVRHTCRHMQTVVMTAYSASHEAREAAQADIFELLEKPLDLERLFRTLELATRAAAHSSAAVAVSCSSRKPRHQLICNAVNK